MHCAKSAIFRVLLGATGGAVVDHVKDYSLPQ